MNRRLMLAIPAFALVMNSLYADAPMNGREGTGRPQADPNQVVLAHPDYSFLMEYRALFLQPSGSNLYYAVEADPFPVVSPDWKIHEVHPHYKYGFDLGIAGVFHSTNTKLSLNWEHLHCLDTDHKNVTLEDMVGPFFEIGPNAVPYTRARGHAFFSFDEVSLDYGVTVDFGSRMRTDFFAGISYSKIRQIMHTKLSSGDKNTIRTIRTPSHYSGLGPQLGLDFSYRIYKGLHFIGSGAGSLYYGKLEGYTRYKSGSPALVISGFTPPNKQRTTTSDRMQVVPGLEAELGLNYTFTFKRHWMIALKAGYQTQIYLNAIQSTDIGSEVLNLTPIQASEGVFARTFLRTLSNFALAGPYVGAELAF